MECVQCKGVAIWECNCVARGCDVLYCGNECADVHWHAGHHAFARVGGDIQDVLNRELETMYDAGAAGGVMFLLRLQGSGGKIVLGKERGGQYRGQYNMFGGKHDVKRTRMETALAEYCEEFGAPLGPRGAEGEVDGCFMRPMPSELLAAKKIFSGLIAPNKGEEHAATIIILLDIPLPPSGEDQFVQQWNANSAAIRANSNVTHSYKEMSTVALFTVDELLNMTPHKKVSYFTLKTVKEMHAMGYISTAHSTMPAAAGIALIEARERKPNPSGDFHKRGFYLYSKKRLAYLRSHDIFTWLCLQSYMTSSLINPILFRVNGDWRLTSFDNQFSNIAAGIKLTPNSGGNPYDAFDVFFAPMLYQAKYIGLPLRSAKRGGAPITTRQEFFTEFPSLYDWIVKPSPREFTRSYIQAIQRTILSVPPLRSPIGRSYRGYKPLNADNSLVMDITKMRVGQEFINWGFMSMSLDSSISAAFSGAASGGTCCMLEITIPAGVSVFMISSDAKDITFAERLTPYTQLEILMPAGTVLKITRLPQQPRAFKNYLNGNTVMSRVAEAIILPRRAKIKF
jgi:8-oxo-dGTP pyrophosphatase MutT (NUDIX family)